MDIIKLIEEMEDVLDEASAVPFSKKVMVEREELLAILKDMRENLPNEIKQAQWTNSEKNRIIDEANKESENIRTQAYKEAEKIDQEARTRFETMINEHDVTIAAQKKAEEITSQAENNARLLKNQSIQYIDEMLETTQEKLRSLVDELESNRNELKG